MTRSIQDILNTPLREITPIEYWILYQKPGSNIVETIYEKDRSKLQEMFNQQLEGKSPNNFAYAKGYFSVLDGTKLIVVNGNYNIDPDKYKEILGKYFYENPQVSDNIMTFPFFRVYIVTEKTKKEAKLSRKYNKNNGRVEWVLVSKLDPQKVLKWFGPHKPSKKKLLSEERRVQWFKHKGSTKIAWLTEEIPVVKEHNNHSFIKDDTELTHKWLSGPKDHVTRNDVFGPHTNTEFGSGLLKKDKEIYPKWEFTETPQFKQNAQDLSSETESIYSFLFIAGLLGQLESLVEVHNDFINWINDVTDKLGQIARGLLKIEVLNKMTVNTGATSVNDFLNKIVSKYLTILTSPEKTQILIMLREGIPNIFSTIELIRNDLNKKITRIQEILENQFFNHDMPGIRTTTVDMSTEYPVTPEGFQPEDWFEIEKTTFGRESYEKELSQLKDIRDQFDSDVQSIENMIGNVYNYIDRLLAWQKPEMKDLSELLKKAYQITKENDDKKAVNFELNLQKINDLIPKRIIEKYFKETAKKISVLPNKLMEFENKYQSLILKPELFQKKEEKDKNYENI
jgi:hypothetical protein